MGKEQELGTAHQIFERHETDHSDAIAPDLVALIRSVGRRYGVAPELRDGDGRPR